MRGNAKREKAQVLSSVPKRGHAEPKRYRGAWWTVDGCFWMAGAIGRASAGTRARVYIAKRGNDARMARIARESCASYRNRCGQYTEWCCELVLYTPWWKLPYHAMRGMILYTGCSLKTSSMHIARVECCQRRFK
ncbi:uncharacterized protein F5891DRAFT_987263 [Suillus fuscotomentosus]|uniref:Uncharacterized protein n=1 Tax=Suillus fuscotomentosus TaxID=1912939 RepID=A0AAD4DRW8_9AGAM|nr:uncharacterized protein F5891DRAFT_987263 [Suillus fuscotomentosus]KAG1889724.1 hypothetical protein F5891DRAFT_987263 [Suillus fuscotomentosus]